MPHSENLLVFFFPKGEQEEPEILMDIIEKVSDTSSDYNFAVDVTPVSWHPSRLLTFDEWEEVGNTLLAVDKSLNFWIGDWVCAGEAQWGEMYLQAEAITGWNYFRLARAKWVASKVPPWLRTQNLSWTSHLAVAALTTDKQKEWLDKAEAEGLRSAELKKAIKAASLPAPTASSNGYGPHDDNDVPFSASGPGVQAEASEWVDNYERESGPYPDSQVDAELMREVAYLLRHYAWKYCRGEQGLPYIEEEKEFWEGEAHRCAVAIDRVNELIAMN